MIKWDGKSSRISNDKYRDGFKQVKTNPIAKDVLLKRNLV